jgi:hypothetical protein
MKDIFPGYYRLTEGDFQKLWKNAIFVLDANVILNLYRYPEKAREDLIKALKKIESRLWVPYQAALEYQRNRQTVVADQRSRFSDVRKILENAKQDTESGMQQLQLKKRHSNINPDKFITSLSKLFSEFTSELDSLEKAHSENIEKDELRDRIEKLLETKIGPRPQNQNEIDDLYKNGEQRFSKFIPPGYLDRKKEKDKQGDEFSYGGINYKRKFGDFIVWNQIIQHAKSSGSKDVIFLTDDDKDDWWWTIESQGRKKLGPRPELVDEIIREANVERFHMYSSEQFLEFADTHLNIKVNKESIAQVTESKEEVRRFMGRSAEPTHLSYLAERAVKTWLSSQYPSSSIISNDRGFPDFTVDLGPDGKLGVEVKSVRSQFVMSHQVDPIFRGYHEVASGNLARCVFVYVIIGDGDENRFARMIRSRLGVIPLGIEIHFGRLTGSEENPTFEPSGQLSA